MAHHNDTGKIGEDIAEAYFKENGFEILHRNWRYKHWEVDAITFKDGILHFMEVKCRNTKKFGFPESSVTKKKIQNLMNASVEFVFLYPQYKRVQFNILSINLHKDSAPEFLFIPDIYAY